eukprot:306391_1
MMVDWLQYTVLLFRMVVIIFGNGLEWPIQRNMHMLHILSCLFDLMRLYFMAETCGNGQSIETGVMHCILQTKEGQFLSFGFDSNGECSREKGQDNAPQLIDEWILNKIIEINQL